MSYTTEELGTQESEDDVYGRETVAPDPRLQKCGSLSEGQLTATSGTSIRGLRSDNEPHLGNDVDMFQSGKNLV